MDDIDVLNTTCADKYDNSIYYGLVYFRCVLSIISIVFILSMLAIMVLFKKYRFFTQRLILYLAISSLIYQVISAVDVTSVRAYYDQTALDYCKAIAFLTQVVIWWPIIATAIIVFEVFVRVVFDKSTKRLEVLYVFLIVVLPLLTNWIPFLYSAYGPSQYFCWILIENFDENCETTIFLEGIIIRVALFFFPCFIITIAMIVCLVIAAIFLRQWKRTYAGKFNPQLNIRNEKMKKEIQPILYYPIVFILSTLVVVVITVYSIVASNNQTGFIIISIITSLTFRLQGVFITIVFVLDHETRKKLNTADIKAAFTTFCSRKELSSEYPAEINAFSDSLVVKKRQKHHQQSAHVSIPLGTGIQ